jgi:hypothetical protein
LCAGRWTGINFGGSVVPVVDVLGSGVSALRRVARLEAGVVGRILWLLGLRGNQPLPHMVRAKLIHFQYLLLALVFVVL